ncbi:MAG: hypothetical protein AB1498_00665 [bacterium]
MKFLYLCPLVFILLLPDSACAEDGKGDTSAVSQEVRSEKEEIKKEEAPVIQEDYSLVPSIISDSLQLYREQGAEAFVESILKGSALEGDRSSTEELERLKRVEKYYGKLLSHKFINILKLAQWYKKIYIVLQFEKGPVFCSIDCYYTSKNIWIVPAFVFNTDIEKVFPGVLLEQYLENNNKK